MYIKMEIGIRICLVKELNRTKYNSLKYSLTKCDNKHIIIDDKMV